uniref:Uncharacterized protein n=1 Tax=Arundo donax TaxID=35708 RepID=A0A0A8YWG8_ARUDO
MNISLFFVRPRNTQFDIDIIPVAVNCSIGAEMINNVAWTVLFHYLLNNLT